MCWGNCNPRYFSYSFLEFPQSCFLKLVAIIPDTCPKKEKLFIGFYFGNRRIVSIHHTDHFLNFEVYARKCQ